MVDTRRYPPEIEKLRQGSKGRIVGQPVLTRASDVTPTQVEWLWEGYLPKGKLTMFDGDPGLGKTLTALDIAARVTRGAAMPDGSPGASGDVIVLSYEDDAGDTLRPRLEAADADLERVHFLQGKTHKDGAPDLIAIPDDIPVLAEAIERTKAVMLLIDPLVAALGSDTNSFRDQDVRRALAPLASLAQETGVAVPLVRHLNKMSGGNALYRGGGSIGIIAAARHGLIFGRNPDEDEQCVVAILKSNVAKLAPSLAYRITDHGSSIRIQWEGVSPLAAADLLGLPGDASDQSRLVEAEDFLRDALSDRSVAVDDLQKRSRSAGYSWTTIERAKKRLRVRSLKQGFGSDGKWAWELPMSAIDPSKTVNSRYDGLGGLSGAEGDDEGF